MKPILFFLVICLVPLLWANKCDKKTDEKQTTKSQKVEVKNAYIDKDYDFTAFEGKYTIKDAVIKDSLLTLTIEANICKDDNVDLVMNGNYLKTYPPKAQLGLKFSENAKCQKNTIIRTYNISPVKYPSGKATIFLIQKHEPMTYNY